MTFGTEGVKLSYILLGLSQVKAKYFLEATTASTFYQKKMDKSQNPPHVLMDTSSVVLTPVLGQAPATVSFDTNALIAVHQSGA